jgi:lysophospholipase L1-like esterase
MANDEKISALPSGGSVQASDEIPVVRSVNGTPTNFIVNSGTSASKAASDNTKATLASVSGTTTAGHIAVFADNAGTVSDGGSLSLGTAASKAASDNSKANVASVSGTPTAGHLAVFADTAGTIIDGGAASSGITALTGDVTASGSGSVAATVVRINGQTPGTLATQNTVSLSSQATGTLQAAQAPALTGDVTSTAGSLATTLATVNSGPGVYSAASITVDAKGRVTAAGTSGLGELQYIASGAALPNSLWGGGPGSGGTAYNQIQSRAGYFMGKASTNVIVIGMVGYTFEPGIGDSVYGNSVSLEAAIELSSPVSYQTCDFGGQAIANVPNGSPGVLSDRLGIFIPGDGEFFVRHGEYSASGGSNVLPGCDQAGPAGTAGLTSQNAPSQIQATGAISGANISGTKIPILLGIPNTPQVAVCIFGDSIADGTGDTPTANGDSGFIARGLVSVNGHRAVCAKQTVGSQSFSTTTVQQCYRSRGLWRYFTQLVCEMGTNDIASATTLSAMQTYATNVWTAAKNTIGPYGKPLQVAQTLIMPRTQSKQYLNTAAIASGGTGYPVSSTFNVTLSGGTLNGGASASTVNVTTNSSGVVTTVNSVANNGGYAYGAAPATPNSPTGSTGTGLSLTLTFGGWTSASDQTPFAGFTVGGVRDQFNTWVKTQVGGGVLDAYIDVNQYVEDQANPGCWLTNGTINYPSVDGVHPTQALHILAAQAVNTWALIQNP